MGTNYYILGYDESDDLNPRWHIGKRSAAGKFCFDCGMTLCKGGLAAVHMSTHDWWDFCPICRTEFEVEKMDKSSAGLELGFNKDGTVIKIGVKTASSFTFAMDLPDLITRLDEEFEKNGILFDMQKKVIVDEYNTEFSTEEFWELIKAIPTSLYFKHQINKEFC